jgi:hypothetical protein
LCIRDFQIKKYSKTDEKILLVSPLSVFSASLWFVFWDNLFLGNPLDISRKDLVTLNLHTNITEIKPLSVSGRGLERGLN